MSVPPEAARELSRAEKQELLRRALMEKISRPRTVPASFAQERLWFLDRMDGAQGGAYIILRALRLSGPLDAAALERALGEVVRRHEALRTTFAEERGSPVQVIVPDAGFQLACHDLSALDTETAEDQVRRLAAEDSARPFDLAAGPLFRAALLHLATDEHVLLLGMHHIVSDGWSMGVLFRELAALYEAYRDGRPSPLPELPGQYADFAVRQRARSADGAMEGQLAYWRAHLAGAPALLALPTDHPRPATQSHRGAREMLHIPPSLLQKLDALGRAERVTRYMVLLAAFKVLLARYAGSEDVVVGTAVSGRGDREVEELIGFFVNTLALRTDLSSDPTFREVLARVRGVTMGAFQNQDIPFEQLVEALQPERSLGHSPLFQVMFTLNDGPGARPSLAGVRAEELEAETGTAKFDLALSFDARAGGLRGIITYATDLFTRDTVRRMARQLEMLLEQVAADPACPLSRLRLADAEELALVMEEWNRTGVEYPARSIDPLFREQAAATPDAVAVVMEDESLTYAELDARADRLARHLRRQGVGLETRVGICLERGPEMIAAILAVLRAGGAYVPLDPAYPPERLAWMLADSAAAVLVTQTSLRGTLPDGGCAVLCVDALPALDAEADGAPFAGGAGPRNLAYVMYTSGSTGTPHGVGVEHRSVVRLVRAANYADFGPREVILQAAPVSFDASTLEIWGALLNGGRLVLVPGRTPSVEELGRILVRHGVTTAWLTAGLFEVVAEERLDDLGGLTQLLAGGDVLSATAVRRVRERFPSLRLINGYGPTENTTFTCCHTVGAAWSGGPVPIGTPVSNTRVYVLDAWLHTLPIGIPGELYAAGDGVARGYLGRAAATAERFIPDPFSIHPGARMYRTGDRARWRADGVVEYLGRLDQQVKIRGFRIEPGEVEAVLRRHPAVTACAVVVRGEGEGEKRLVAYVVGDADEQSLRAHLRARVPEHMVPAAFVAMDALPLTPNGKVDRRALPAPDFAGDAERYVAPRTPAEEVLAAVWAELLGVERVGTADGFFALGGHSLLATRVVSRIRELFAVELPVRALFEAPTVAELAARVEAARLGAAPLPAPLVPRAMDAPPLSFAQERLWFLDRMEPGSAAYNVPAALRLSGALDAAALERALGEVVRRHAALRTVFAPGDGVPVQSVSPFAGFTLPIEDLSSLSSEEREEEAERRAAEHASAPFDLAAGPLFRAVLLRLADGEHLLLLCMHHAVSDGWSLGVFFRELSASYTAFRDGGEPRLPELPVQYADYAVWQREQLRGEGVERPLAWWKERLAGAPALLELPTDHPRPAQRTQRGGGVWFTLPPGLLPRLRTLGRREGATPFMVLLGAFQVLLARYAGVSDVVVGTPIAGRTRRETEGLIGFFANTLALRTEWDGDPSFRELLRTVRGAMLGAYEHQELPFERLVAELQPERSLSHSPLFQVLFTLDDEADARLPVFPGVAVQAVEPEMGTAKFDLGLAVRFHGDGARCRLAYATDLFHRGTVERMAGHLVRLLEQVADDADRPLSRLDLLAEEERGLVLHAWNQTEAAPGADHCIHQLFEAQAARTPDATAVLCGTDALTYRALDERANRLARHLARLGAGPEVRVGVCLERGTELVVALLAVLKTGGAYLPLDPAYPTERLALTLEDADARVVVTQESLRGLLPGAFAVASVDGDASAIVAESAAALDAPVSPRGLAYLIYTSGSTGRPKGVAIEHRATAAFLAWAAGVFAPEELAGTLACTSVCFDLSVFEIFLPLARGGRVIVVENALALPRAAAAGEVRILNTVPSAAAALLATGGIPAGVRTVNLAGEPLRTELVDALYAAGVERVYDLYGPSEDTTYSTFALRRPGAPPTIGAPIAGTRAYVLDPGMNPSPVGVPGELFLGGLGLARGYLGRPGLTAERFLPDPFSAEPGARVYRTGDRARWRESAQTGAGELEYLGRVDHQVKIRGFRIEPGEIEAALRRHPAVRDCVVVAHEFTPGDRRLVAYVAGDASAEALRAHLRAALPEYMVPGTVVLLDALPLTPNGKLDRRALPAPEPAASGRRLAPRTGLESRLAGLWRELLGVERVGVEDNFFDLGGHSLLLARVQARIAADLGRDIPVVELFLHPTVRSLAARLRRDGVDDGAAAVAGGGAERDGRGRRGGRIRPVGARASGRMAPRRGPGREVAVVGMAGRFPGADDVQAFWRNLRGGTESISRFSREELLAAGVDPALVDQPGFVPAGGALRGADEFDAALFGLTPRDAEVLNPQHRVLLECAWAALEHAGYDPARVGHPVGVFAGASTNAYASHLHASPEIARSVGSLRLALGNERDHLAAGIAYRLNLHGPALAVQTACSTSLVAVHLACQSLAAGECDMALAGGVSVRMPLRNGYLFTPDGILSPDGHCRAFDADARGTVAGSGGGMVVLKRLADALADGDTIHAVIRGSSINNDGAQKVGYTAPSVTGQARVLSGAMALAGVDPATLQYLEAHGSGTPLGDAIELRAIREALPREGAPPLAIGSVKTNVGHLDAAAGVAGLIKTVLALEHAEIPPSLHCAAPHPDLLPGGIVVNTALRAWERTGAPRRAGVSSFGIGGTNAHAVLEEAPPRTPSGPSRALQLLVLSARTPTALAAAAERLGDFLETEDPPLADAAFTLQCGRREMEHRLAVVCADAADGAAGLRRAAARALPAVARTDRPVAFMFPGVGMQYVNMGRGLYDTEPVYRAAVDECCALLRPELGADLRETLFSAEPAAQAAGGWDLRRMLARGGDEASPLDETRLAQPAVFVTGYAMARLWMSWGVAPRALIGHSLGEYVAACVAGVMRLEDALRLVALRARLLDALPAGAMVAVPLGEAELRTLLPAGLDLAAVNTVESCVVAGPEAGCEAFEAELAARGIVSRRLAARHAFHSRAMRPVAAELERLLAGVELRPPRIPLVSNVTGEWMSDEEACSPAYWARHLCSPVRFADGVATLCAEPGWVLLESGPGQTLGAWAMQNPTGDDRVVFGSVRHPHNRIPDLRLALETLGGLWAAGVEVDWAGFSRGERRHRVPLPGYAFERRRYWVDAPARAGGALPAAAGMEVDDGAEAQASHQKGPAVMETRLAEQDTAAASPRQEAVLRQLRAIAAGLTGIAEHLVDTETDFFRAGFDSLLLLQAIQAVEKRMGVRVPLVELLEDIPNFVALAAHVDRRLPPDAVVEEERADEPAPPAVQQTPPAAPAVHSDPVPAAAPAAPVPAPPAFYPAPAPALVAAPVFHPAAPAGESMMERVIAQQLQSMTHFMTQQLAMVHGIAASAPPAVSAPYGPANGAASYEPHAHASNGAHLQRSDGQHAPASNGSPPHPSNGSHSSAQNGSLAHAANGAAAHGPGAHASNRSSAALMDAPANSSNGSPVRASDGQHAHAPVMAVPQSPRAKIQPETFVAYLPLNTEAPGAMTARQREYLDGFIARYVERTRASKAHQARYHVPLADSRVTARFRRVWKEITYPIVGQRALGARVWDVDGNEYVDTGMAFGCSLFGHAPDFVADAIREQLDLGFGVGPQSPDAGRAAELVCQLGNNDRAVFCNSGTEAVMGAIRAARAYTGRSRIAYFAGSYHGWSDIVQGRLFASGEQREVRPSAPGVAGLPLGDVLMLDFDEPASLELLARHLHEIAVVMVEPVQSRRPDLQPFAFLRELRRMTREAGTLLLFDELITGFRMAPGGAQEFFGIQADLVTYGKIVAGGLPMGVVAGTREVMSVFDGGLWNYGDDSYPTGQRTLFAGAYFKHPISMNVACAILGEIQRRGAPMYEQLNARTTALVERMNAFFEAEDYPVTAAHFSSAFRFFFGPQVKFPELFSHHMILEGIHVIPETGTHFLSTAHTDEDLDIVFHAVRASVRAMREGGFIPGGADQGPGAASTGGSAGLLAGAVAGTAGRDTAGITASGAPGSSSGPIAFAGSTASSESTAFSGSMASTGLTASTASAAFAGSTASSGSTAPTAFTGSSATAGSAGLTASTASTGSTAATGFSASGGYGAAAGTAAPRGATPEEITLATYFGSAGPEVREIPLTEGQRQLWIESQMGEHASLAYIESTMLRLRGVLDAAALHRALQALVDRHATLRATVSPDGETQLIHPAMQVPLPRADFRAVAPAEREARVQAWVDDTVQRPFDLVRGPLVRFALAAVDDGEHLLLFDVHHVVLDGWSLSILLRELGTLYTAEKEGRDAGLPPRPDHAALVDAQVRSGTADPAADAFWAARFADGVPVLELPSDRPRPPVRSYRGERSRRDVDPELMRRLAAAGRPHGLSLFHTFFSAFYVWLHRLTGQDDIVVGTPSAGQAARGAASDLVGYAINVLPIRVQVDPSATFTDLARQVRRAILGAVERQGFSFPRLVESLLRTRDTGRPPLFSVMLNVDRAPEEMALGDLRAGVEANFGGGSKLDLNLEITEAPDALRLACDFSTDLFDRETVESWLAGFEQVLRGIADDAEVPLARLSLAGARERRAVLEEWNRTDHPYPREACIHDLFHAQVGRTPGALALEWGDERLTYAELDARANRLAHHLLGLGVAREERVGVLLERGVEQVVAILAVLKAGGCCVPVDTSYPAERMRLMLADAGAWVLLIRGALAAGMEDDSLRIVALDAIGEALAREPAEAPPPVASAQNLAYVFYTSGSTGRPKGVMMGHGDVVQLAACVRECMPMGPGDRVAQASNASFDAAVFEFWCALAHGAALVGIDREVLLNARALRAALRDSGITHLYQTAALFSQHVREQVDVYAGLRQLVFGAEAVDTESVRRMLADGRPERVLHEYGPTEATVWCTLDRVEAVAPGAATVPIGRPIPNARAYVLDAAMQPVPPAVPGELCIGGAGVVRGYLGRPALTAEKFIPDPFSARPGARMYRTGDRVRWRGDGRLDFMGRLDEQVKIRGFRIEPGEVEAALAAYPGVREARVLVRQDAPGDKRLVAYVAGAAPAEELRAHLRGRLPEYMVPAAFVVVERLPLTPNGKLDRRALPAPEYAAAGAEYTAPRDPAEEELAAIWAAVLGVERVGVHDGFFELGGHSLLATRVVSRVRERFGVELPLRALFEAPTVAGVAERIRALRGADAPRLSPVVPVDRDGPLPASFAQERLWFLDRLQPGGSFFNVPVPLRLYGPLDVPALERALGEVLRRHEALRTVFAQTEGSPVQVVTPFRGFTLPVEELPEMEAGAVEDELSRQATLEAARPFDLSAGPLFRARLLRMEADDHALLLCIHHAVVDGWSLDVLFRELAAAYDAFRHGGAPALEPLPVQYADFAVWQREQLRGAALERQVAWWRERLEGAPELLRLPTDRPRPAVMSFRGAYLPIHMPRELVDGLEALARREGATLYMVMLAGFKVLLSRWGGGEDIVVGSTIAGRTRGETEGLIGLFMNTLVLRTDLSGDPDFRTVLRRVRDVTVGAYEHQDVPFEKLVDELRPERTLSHSPLFQVLFEVHEGIGSVPTLPGVEVSRVQMEVGSAKADLGVALRVTERGLVGGLTWATDLFDAGTVRWMVEHLERVLRQVAADPGRRVSRLRLMGEAERGRMLAWNTAAAFPAERCIHELFQDQARATPDAPAVVWGSGGMTYRELDDNANRLANHLVRAGVGPETRVGICLERGPELVIAILGVMKAGGAWVPADPAHPAERIAYVLEDAGVAAVLTQARLRDRVPSPAGVRVIAVDAEWARIAEEPATAPESGVTSENLAYVIFTSGSTGRPKGVAMHHRGVANYIHWAVGAYGADRGNGAPVFTSMAVDLTLTNFLPLFTGKPVRLLPEDNPVEGLARVLREKPGFGLIKITPVHLALLTPMLTEEEARAAAGTLVVGADLLPAEATLWWADHAPGVRLVNEYGPTETVVGCSAYLLPPGSQRNGAVPVGPPIQNLRFYVLDASGEPVPAGLPGELYIGGAGVARGYLGRPALSAEKFLPDPFAQPGSRMYRTGDSARWQADGNLMILGRTDHQVKVRGYRVELGEVEAVLRRHPSVSAALVTVREDRPGDRRLVAYVVGGADAAELRGQLRRALPEYMVPDAFVHLDELPRTRTGKVDPRTLPAPVYGGEDRRVDEPRNFVEARLIPLWEELLGVPGVGPRDSFFDLGGNSFLALRLFTRVNRLLDCDLPVATLFAGATLRHMADAILEQKQSSADAPGSVVPLQPDGTLPPVFLVHSADRNVMGYVNLVRHLGPEQPVYGVRDTGEDLARPVARIAAEHVAAIRAVQPHGPYYLASWSFGGIVAFEMAVQLEQAGEEVAFTGLLDTTAPGLMNELGWERDADIVVSLAHDVAVRERRPFRLSAEELEGMDLDGQVRVAVQALRDQDAAPAEYDAERLGAACRMVQDRTRSYSAYRPGRLSGPLVLFRAEVRTGRQDGFLATRAAEEQHSLGWAPHAAGPVEVHDVPGHHAAITAEPHVRVLADRMRDSLRAARLRAGWSEPAAERAGEQAVSA